MTAPHIIDPARFLSEQLEQASPDHMRSMRSMLTTFVNALMSVEADAGCGAGYGARFEASSNWLYAAHRNSGQSSPMRRFSPKWSA